MPRLKFYTELSFVRVKCAAAQRAVDARDGSMFRKTRLGRSDTFSQILASLGWTQTDRQTVMTRTGPGYPHDVLCWER